MSLFSTSRMLFILLSTALSFTGSAQVYLSHFNGELFVGPANVVPTNIAVCDFMIEDLQNAKDEMRALRLELVNLQGMNKLKRRDKRRKVNLESSMLSRGNDVKAVEILQSAWIKHKELLGSINQVPCYKLERNGLQITHQNSSLNPFCLASPRPYVDLIRIPLDEPIWVKKKANNCLSANPEDCLIWCMVSESRILYDVLGNQIEEHQLQLLNLEYDKKQKRYYGKEIISAGDTSYELILNESEGSISIEGVEMVECVD